MRYLLDTCFLSELVKSAPESTVTQWLAQRKATDLYVSALTIGELNRGVLKLVESKRRTELTTWLQLLEVSFESRMLAFTHETARVWAKITAECDAQGKPLSVIDSLIAATALAKDLTLVTRNVKDFASTSVHIVNPWVRDLGPSAGRL